MKNSEIAQSFQLLATLMELEGEDDFRSKSYNNAYRILKNVEGDLQRMSLAELKEIKGIGDAIGKKIQELQQKGKMQILDGYLEKTPPGIVKLLGIKGMGVKKVRLLWDKLGIESPGELLYACQENRLVGIEGFGAKTQENIQKQLIYYFQSEHRFRWASVEEDAENILLDLQDVFGDENVLLTGQFRRLLPVVDYLEFVLGDASFSKLEESNLFTDLKQEEQGFWSAKSKEVALPIRIYPCSAEFLGLNLLNTTGGSSFVKSMLEIILPNQANLLDLSGLSEEQLFEKAEIDYIEPELRDADKIFFKVKALGKPALIEGTDVVGVLHAHSTYSDGAPSLKELAAHVKSLDFTYLGITDHSQSAVYANGLRIERLEEQWREIDLLNQELAPFKILKGIEADIRFDGELDYEDAVLARFDFVIASVHSALKMTEDKATERILKAISNPYTSILGHPTGRLLLSRQGYPIRHKEIIDACALHEVAIELNSNPLRLDMDYEWIPYALEKGVFISINPDAHSLQGVHDIRYGVQVARKGMLNAENCLTAWSLDKLENWLKGRLQRKGIVVNS